MDSTVRSGSGLEPIRLIPELNNQPGSTASNVPVDPENSISTGTTTATSTTISTSSTTSLANAVKDVKEEVGDPISDIICGSLAGATGKLIEYPFDTVKVRLQSQPVDSQHTQFRGPLDCFRKSIQSEGIRGLYRGISSPIVGAAAENAALFFAYNILQNFIKDNNIQLSTSSASLVCGAGSGVFASFILTPIELVKCRIQVQMMQQTGPRVGAFKTILSIYKADGIRGFWRGQTGTLIRESGGSAAWFGAYEYVSALMKTVRGKEAAAASNNTDSMLAGAAAGISYNLSLFPADTIKSRMQTEQILNTTTTTNAVNSTSKGFFATGATIYRQGGISALYRGCGITLARAAPSSAVIFLVYENLKGFKNKYL
ncbi:Ort1p [Sugiyamaella lignohabitans]|uniref:Ort1p n=1 Tax=Sugiyamaella lignohabitans TaxID=796027 RepID=A0A167D431_9ASCO|nr:Ort1p [Sugiyamaella lignohabitans]ANB12452.1 Ort1p [Sugiyamaella lignohabitans]